MDHLGRPGSAFFVFCHEEKVTAISKFFNLCTACGTSLLLAAAARADIGPVPAETPHTNAAAVKAEAAEVLRDPFSPIGFAPLVMPGQGKASDAVAGPAKASQPGGVSGMLKIGGVVQKGGKYYATINGFTVKAGEIVTTVWNGAVYKFLVEKIDLKTVKVKLLKQ